MPIRRILPMIVLLAPLVACDEIRDTSDLAADSTKRTIYDAKERWKDLLTYRPRHMAQRPLPQTRYCYRMQSDIVCYDAPQQGITAPLVGYQDGPTISWYKPGGGSMGFSAPPAPVAQAVTMQPVVSSAATTAPSPVAGEVAVKPNPPFKKQVK